MTARVTTVQLISGASVVKCSAWFGFLDSWKGMLWSLLIFLAVPYFFLIEGYPGFSWFGLNYYDVFGRWDWNSPFISGRALYIPVDNLWAILTPILIVLVLWGYRHRSINCVRGAALLSVIILSFLLWSFWDEGQMLVNSGLRILRIPSHILALLSLMFFSYQSQRKKT